MICPDCELEVDKLTKLGVCKKCYQRIAQFKYKGKEYIPLRTIKGTPEYRQAMNKRVGLKVAPSKPIISESIYVSKENKKDEIFTQVSEDVMKNFKDYGLTQSYLEVDISNFIDTFFTLLQEENFMKDCEKAEKIFNKISSDYLHLAENSEWGSYEMNKHLMCEKALLELRRPTKNKYYEFKTLEPVIEYLKGNDTFKELLSKAREDYMNIQNNDMTYKLKATTLDNDLGIVRRWKKYNWHVPCFNLYGNPGQEDFVSDRPITARNEDEAIRKITQFLDNHFDITYKPENIKLEEVQI